MKDVRMDLLGKRESQIAMLTEMWPSSLVDRGYGL